VQVESRKLSKGFRGPSIGDRDLVRQFTNEDNVHHHPTGWAKFHTDPSYLKIRVVQVESCKLPKELIGLPPGRAQDLVRQFIDEGWSGASCRLLNFVVKCDNILCKW
jgi:hypothetical protein